MWRVILGQDIEEILSGSKGVTMDNFSISVKWWWKMSISHLKHSYLNWRVIPCKRKKNDSCVCNFSSFFQHFLLSWFLFRLNRYFFKCMTWQSIFLCFAFFFSFSWSVYSGQQCMSSMTFQIEALLFMWEFFEKGSSFGSRVVRVISVQTKGMAQKISIYVSKERGYGSKGCWYHFC